jgi:hypothetical protein
MTILSGALVFFLCVFYRQVHGKQSSSSSDDLLKEDLEYLDRKERAAISFFRNDNTINMPFDDPVTAGLIAKKILVFASRTGDRRKADDGHLHIMFPMMLAPEARKILAANGWASSRNDHPPVAHQ